MKLKRLKVWGGNIVTVVMVITIVVMAFVIIASKVSGGDPKVFGYELKTVLSGSMEPEIKTGSIIAVKPGGDMTDFIENDVITFQQQDGKLITHRIVEVVGNGDNVLYRTKGDSNGTPDSNLVLADNVVAKYNGFTIPYIGYIISFAQSQNGAFLLLVPGFLLLLFACFTVWQTLAQIGVTTGKEAKKEQEDSCAP
ncbi:signal peptidase I SipW [Radiobacillus sp. PE A8.2]|uniref:signal peptidase I SipW n=1 Tax=Radiobacillus sp. PE A8.2 TaxID=3380349 RepID=UPI00388E8B66